ncbi:hypothetical protein DAPK24_008620 [Pichia kluyveri]|uniref:Uncharacterized protein n=1 Tax=Pichia kluyveri TaxID=36015 RepID=A0AAV5QZR8_PICKL|nr:hypothetical protein DAPK24_008620 [Pichia kluyveri]
MTPFVPKKSSNKVSKKSSSKVSNAEKSLPLSKRNIITINDTKFHQVESNDGFVMVTPLSKNVKQNSNENVEQNSNLPEPHMLSEIDEKIIKDFEKGITEKGIEEHTFGNVSSLSEEELSLLHPALHDLACHFNKYHDELRSHINSIDAERKSLILTHYYFMKRFSKPISYSEVFVDWFYDILKYNPGYITCNKDFFKVEVYRHTLIKFSNPKYLKHARFKRLYGDTPYTIHRNFEQELFNLLQKKSNFQDGRFDMMYFAGKDYPGFMRLPVSVKRKMTINDVKPLTMEMIDKKVNDVQYSLSMIYIFREAVKKYHSENNNPDSNVNANDDNYYEDDLGPSSLYENCYDENGEFQMPIEVYNKFHAFRGNLDKKDAEKILEKMFS